MYFWSLPFSMFFFKRFTSSFCSFFNNEMSGFGLRYLLLVSMLRTSLRFNFFFGFSLSVSYLRFLLFTVDFTVDKANEFWDLLSTVVKFETELIFVSMECKSKNTSICSCELSCTISMLASPCLPPHVLFRETLLLKSFGPALCFTF